MIRMRDIYKIYGTGAAEVRALDGVDLTVGRGEFLSVMGPSGSGKSTCMNMVGCLDVPTSGSYEFWGVDVGELNNDELALLRRHYIGFVFQGFNLLPRMSAVENVQLPLIYKNTPRRERRPKAMEALGSVGLAARADHKPSELSGGQKQRVAIARALVTEPTLLLADEPTGNLDTKTSDEIIELLERLNRERNLTIVMVSHEPEFASHAERIVYFVDGRVTKDGTPAEVLS
jgi:putative ABC transport system ATP-binding protein